MLNFKSKVVPVDIDGTTVHVRELSAGDRTKLFVKVGDSKADTLVCVAMFCVCDQDGTRLYTDDDQEHVEALPAPVVDAIAKAGLSLNGLEAKSVDDAKNS